MKKLFLSLGIAAVGLLSANAQGSLLVVHNSPDPALSNLDLWVEVPQAAYYQKAIDDLAYQGGYFYSIPAVPIPGATLTIHLKANNSTASGDVDLYSKTFTVVPTGNNILIVTGLTSALSGTKTNPNSVDNTTDLILLNSGVAFSSNDNTKAALSLHHGVVDAPGLVAQSFITTIQSPKRDTLANDAQYKDVTANALVSASSRRLHFIATGNAQTNTTYQANGDELKSLGGKGVFVVTSGFLDTTGTGTTNTFKVLGYVTDAATAAGAITAVEFPKEKVAGLVQVFHNAADPSVKAVDLYVGGMKQILGLNFRAGFQSAGFIQDFDYVIDLHKKDSASSVLSTTLRFDNDSVVAGIAGLVDTAGFAANPDGAGKKLNFFLHFPARVTQPTGSTQVTVFHGATDGPTIGLTSPALGGAALITGQKYGEFQVANAPGVGTSLPTALGNVVVDLKFPGGTTFKSYIVPLAAFAGKAVTILASGFVDSTANHNGPAFKFLAGLPSSPFPQMLVLKDTNTTQVSINDPAKADLQFRLFPNPATTELVMAFDVNETSNVAIDIIDLNGRVVKNVVSSVFDNGTVALTEDIRDLQGGLYIARVKSDARTSTYRFNVVR
jgi:hypothetical protein